METDRSSDEEWRQTGVVMKSGDRSSDEEWRQTGAVMKSGDRQEQ